MNVKFYPKSPPDASGQGYSVEDIQKGLIWLYADVTCPSCGKEQSVANTGYVGGPCIRCGELTK